MRNTRVKNEWQRIEKLSSQQNTQSSPAGSHGIVSYQHSNFLTDI